MAKKKVWVKGHWRRKPKGKHPNQYAWINPHYRKPKGLFDLTNIKC